MEKVSISEQTEIWLQLYSRTNRLAQDIFNAIRDEQGETDGDTPRTEELFAPFADGLNASAAKLLDKVTTQISNNMAEGGTMI